MKMVTSKLLNVTITQAGPKINGWPISCRLGLDFAHSTPLPFLHWLVAEELWGILILGHCLGCTVSYLGWADMLALASDAVCLPPQI